MIEEIKIDLTKALRGMREVQVSGKANTRMRRVKIEKAIALSQEEPDWGDFKNRFFGVKNYAHFGDQDCDCERGYGPKHGYIVFRIEKVYTAKKVAEDGIYLLKLCAENSEVDVCGLLNEYLTRQKCLEVTKEDLKKLEEFKEEA